jgi:hypothetical protein
MAEKGYWVNKLLNQQFNKRSLKSKITFISSYATFYDEIMRSVYNLQNAKCKNQNAQFETIFSVKPSSAFGTWYLYFGSCNLYFGIFTGTGSFSKNRLCNSCQ